MCCTFLQKLWVCFERCPTDDAGYLNYKRSPQIQENGDMVDAMPSSSVFQREEIFLFLFLTCYWSSLPDHKDDGSTAKNDNYVLIKD